jgi:hypothetical protein
MNSVEINKVDDREDDICHADQQGNCQFIVKRKWTQEPIVAVRALNKPPAPDNTPAPRAVIYYSDLSLFPCADVSLQFFMNIQALSTFAAPYVSGLEVIPHRFFAASRTLDYKHGYRSPLYLSKPFMMRPTFPLV